MIILLFQESADSVFIHHVQLLDISLAKCLAVNAPLYLEKPNLNAEDNTKFTSHCEVEITRLGL